MDFLSPARSSLSYLYIAESYIIFGDKTGLEAINRSRDHKRRNGVFARVT